MIFLNFLNHGLNELLGNDQGTILFGLKGLKQEKIERHGMAKLAFDEFSGKINHEKGKVDEPIIGMEVS